MWCAKISGFVDRMWMELAQDRVQYGFMVLVAINIQNYSLKNSRKVDFGRTLSLVVCQNFGFCG